MTTAACHIANPYSEIIYRLVVGAPNGKLDHLRKKKEKKKQIYCQKSKPNLPNHLNRPLLAINNIYAPSELQFFTNSFCLATKRSMQLTLSCSAHFYQVCSCCCLPLFTQMQRHNIKTLWLVFFVQYLNDITLMSNFR